MNPRYRAKLRPKTSIRTKSKMRVMDRLVKEIRNLESGELVPGHPVLWGGKSDALVLMVKNAKERFPGNPLWADGWGWALFKEYDPKTNNANSYEADCKNCHVWAEKSDRVFMQGYPILGSR